MDSDVAPADLHRNERVIGSEIGHQRVLILTGATEGAMRPNRLAMAPGKELHAPVLDRGVVDREPTSCGSAIFGVDPVGLILMPSEDGVSSARLLGEELVEVEHHALAAQLLGNRQPDTFEDVVLPVGVVSPRQHHVEDRIGRWIGAKLPVTMSYRSLPGTSISPRMNAS